MGTVANMCRIKRLYCPKCGELLEAATNALRCNAGQTTFAKELSDRLVACYITEERRPKELPFGFAVGGTWFCPACERRAEEAERGRIMCPQCGRSLNEFIHSLIERHPHADGKGGWR
jgi:predicted amidophosphoribosyltransferase